MTRYIYNTKTHVLHIEGYCPNANASKITSIKIFSIEDEALAYDGRAVGLCKKCQRKREKMLLKTSNIKTVSV